MIKIRNYTQDELDYISSNYENMTVKQLSEHLGKEQNSVYNAVRKLGLVKQPHSSWTDEDIAYLKENYIEKSSEEIAKVLNKTINAVNSKRDFYGLIRHESWSDNDILFLKNNYENMEHSEIAKELNRTTAAITAKCHDLGLYKKEPEWTDEEIDFLKENYFYMSRTEISEILKRSVDGVGLKATRIGLKSSPYYCDYHYFDCIDTEEKAYWLGFLSADGWAYYNKRTKSGTIGVELQYGDINHLKKFNKSLHGNYRITDRWRTCSISTSTKKNHFCSLRIYSITLFNGL